MKKHGFTFIEVSAAIAVLAVCAVSFAGLVAMTTSERIAERTRQTAVDQMQNVFEYLTEPEKIAAGDFDKTSFESLIERSLPDGNIAFETKTVPPDYMTLTMTVSWNAGAKRPRQTAAMFRLFRLAAPVEGENQ